MALAPWAKPAWEQERVSTSSKPVGPVISGTAYLNGKPVNVSAKTPAASTTASASYNPYADYMSSLEAQRTAAIQRQEELARRKQEIAQQAYDKNMSSLNAAYDNRGNLLKTNYEDALKQMQGDYEYGAQGVNTNADTAQQQAYVNYMLGKRDLPQALVAQGITGGASETTMARMQNSYGNNRNTIDKGRNESLAALLNALNGNKSSALQSYNTALSNDNTSKLAYQMQLEQALANGSADILTGQYDALADIDTDYSAQIAAAKKAAASAAAKSYAPAQTAKTNTAQANDITKTALYSRAKSMFNSGNDVDLIIQDLGSVGATPQDIQDVLKGLGLNVG